MRKGQIGVSCDKGKLEEKGDRWRSKEKLQDSLVSLYGGTSVSEMVGSICDRRLRTNMITHYSMDCKNKRDDDQHNRAWTRKSTWLLMPHGMNYKKKRYDAQWHGLGCEKANTLIQIILTSYPSTVQDVGTGCRRVYRAGLISVEIIVHSPKTSFCFRGAAWRGGKIWCLTLVQTAIMIICGW